MTDFLFFSIGLFFLVVTVLFVIHSVLLWLWVRHKRAMDFVKNKVSHQPLEKEKRGWRTLIAWILDWY